MALGLSHQRADWGAIHAGKYVYEVGCWNTCNGGACCKTDHPDFDFQLIPKGNGAVILYMEDEYHYFANRNQVPAAAPQRITLDFGGPRPLVIYHVFCGLLGKCDGVLEKPFLCKIYPFMPILTTQGSIESISHASIFEMTSEVIQGPSPCTVLNKKRQYQNFWSANPEILAPLRNPYVVFYLQAVKFFAQSYEKRMKERPDLISKAGTEFWSEWEIAYLSGDLFDTQEIAAGLLKVYQELSAIHGDFLTPVNPVPDILLDNTR